MVDEARMEQTPHGREPRGEGWFVLNAREARWSHRPERGEMVALTGWTDEECMTLFPHIGVNLYVLRPGEPIGVYHWEAETEEFLVLRGEALLLVEGQERRLRQWDFVHCPPDTPHMIVGAVDAPCAVLAIGARGHGIDAAGWGGYVAAEVARRHGVAPDEDTSDADRAYARYAAPERVRYQDGWLPDG